MKNADRGFPPGHTMLTGPAHLIDAPLTVEDWRIVYHAYYAFITVVRKVARDAWERQDKAAPPARRSTEGSDG